MNDYDDDKNDDRIPGLKILEEKFIEDTDVNKKEAGFNLLNFVKPVLAGISDSQTSQKNKNWSGASSFIEMVAVPHRSFQSRLLLHERFLQSY